MHPRIIRIARAAARARLGLAALALVACPLAAQDQPVAFVHGYNAEPQGWESASNALAGQFAISPLRPDLIWTRRFEAQRATLESALAGQTMPAVGHSNGGLVSRYHVGASGTNTVDRIMAVNSGHHGAPLAGNILNYRAKAFVVTLTDAVAAPWAYQWLPIRGGNRIRAMTGSFSVTVAQRWDPLNAPVLHDMKPGSDALARMEANRGTEQARAWSRVGVGTSASPDGIMCHGLVPDTWRDCNKLITVGKYLYLAAGTYNLAGSWFPLPGAKPHVAPFWFYGSYRLARVNVDWLRLIGAGGTWNGITGRPAPSDGILPFSSQQYPGATRQRNLEWPQYNISHQEANDAIPEMLATYSDVFRNNFGLAVRTYSGGGPTEPEPWEPTCAPSPRELVCAQ